MRRTLMDQKNDGWWVWQDDGTEDGFSTPKTPYLTREDAVARVLQLLNIESAVAQSWPEKAVVFEGFRFSDVGNI